MRAAIAGFLAALAFSVVVLAAIAILDHLAALAFVWLDIGKGFLAAIAKNFQDDFSFEQNLLTDKANDFLQLIFGSTFVALKKKIHRLSTKPIRSEFPTVFPNSSLESRKYLSLFLKLGLSLCCSGSSPQGAS